MICDTVVINGVRAIVCRRGPRRPRQCQVLGCRAVATRQCDFPRRIGRLFETCDRWLCEEHAVSVGPNRDYCPHHPKPARQMELTL